MDFPPREIVVGWPSLLNCSLFVRRIPKRGAHRRVECGVACEPNVEHSGINQNASTGAQPRTGNPPHSRTRIPLLGIAFESSGYPGAFLLGFEVVETNLNFQLRPGRLPLRRFRTSAARCSGSAGW